MTIGCEGSVRGRGRSTRVRGRSARGCGRLTKKNCGRSARGHGRSTRQGRSSSSRGQQRKLILTIVNVQTKTNTVQEVFPFEPDKPAEVYSASGTDTANPESLFIKRP